MNQITNQSAGFLQIIVAAIARLKQQLQYDYERAYPQLRELIHIVLDEEEAHAWDLTPFPHLVLPDLVEAHLTRLNLRPVKRRRADAGATEEQHQFENNQTVFALCA